jgi:hypothetical protein
MLIGVPRTFIVRWYMLNLGAINALIGLVTWISLSYLKSSMDGFAAAYSYELYDGLHPYTYFTVVSTLVVIWGIQFIRIRKLDK